MHFHSICRFFFSFVIWCCVNRFFRNFHQDRWSIPFTMHACMLSPFHCVWLFATLWTIAHQAPLIHAILQARILEWLPCPPPGDLSNPGIKPASPALQADSLLLSHRGRELLLHSDYQTLLSKRIIILQNIFYLPSLKTLLSNRKKKKKKKEDNLQSNNCLSS